MVAVIVGTDHHPFDRLVQWCDRFAAENPQVMVRIQYGSAASPAYADGSPTWTFDELRTVVTSAHTVISHGGPATISAIRSGGTQPVVLPGDPAMGEHVDAHQIRFVERVAAAGLVDHVPDERSLRATLLRRLSLPRGFGLEPVADQQRVNASVQRFARLVDELPQRRGDRISLLRRWVK